MADEDPALMTFSDDEIDESMFEIGFDPFVGETAADVDVQDPFSTGASYVEQEAADTGGSSSSGAIATQLNRDAIPTVVLTEIQRERIAENKRCAASKKEARKLANLSKRKTALEKKMAREGVGALSGVQLDVLRGVPAASVAKVEESLAGGSTSRTSVERTVEATDCCSGAVEKKTLKRLGPASVAKDEELDHWLSLGENERARKLARSLESLTRTTDRKVTRSQVRLTAGSGGTEPVVGAEASNPVTTHRSARPVWGSAWRR